MRDSHFIIPSTLPQNVSSLSDVNKLCFALVALTTKNVPPCLLWCPDRSFCICCSLFVAPLNTTGPNAVDEWTCSLFSPERLSKIETPSVLSSQWILSLTFFWKKKWRMNFLRWWIPVSTFPPTVSPPLLSFSSLLFRFYPFCCFCRVLSPSILFFGLLPLLASSSLLLRLHCSQSTSLKGKLW